MSGNPGVEPVRQCPVPLKHVIGATAGRLRRRGIGGDQQTQGRRAQLADGSNERGPVEATRFAGRDDDIVLGAAPSPVLAQGA